MHLEWDKSRARSEWGEEREPPPLLQNPASSLFGGFSSLSPMGVELREDLEMEDGVYSEYDLALHVKDVLLSVSSVSFLGNSQTLIV